MVNNIQNNSKNVFSREVLRNFFTHENFKKFFIEFKFIFYGLTLFGVTHLASEKINGVFDEVKSSVQNTLNENFNTQFDISKQIQIQKIFESVTNELGHQNIESSEFQKKLYDEVKAYEEMTGVKLVQSLILGFLYGFAYLKTIRRIKKEYMKIDVKSFSTFSLTSGGMVLVNGVVPGSLVYLESFLLAGYAVFLHLQNVVNEKHKESDNQALNDALKLNPIPTSRYDETGKPIVWNYVLEKETGYSYLDVVEYFEEYGEIMTLLYRGENLEKVKKYLEILQTTGEGYQNVAFTLTTKSGEEKIFLWTTQPDSLISGGNIRFAQHLTDIEEIKRRLEETEKLFKIDAKTKAFNEETFLGDLEGKIIDKRRKTAFIVGMFDIDDFKAINDKYGHSTGDKVLVELVSFLKQSLRDTDIIYRLHGDEFSVLFDSDNIEELSKKIHTIKYDFSLYIQHTLGLDFPVGTTWGLSKVLPYSIGTECTSSKIEKEKIDRYMYGVKYFQLIAPELLQAGIIQENYKQKNGVSYPLYDTKNNFLGIQVITLQGSFTLSLGYLELIEQRKKQLDNSKIREGEKR